MKFISSIKKSVNKEITFLILPSYRRINKDHRSLIKIDNNYFIEKQINTIASHFGNCDILCVSNVKNSKFNKIKNNFRILENSSENYSDFENLRLSVQNINSTNLVIIPENILFDPKDIDTLKSTAFYLTENNQDYPGFITIRDIITNISYGNFPTSSGIYFLTQKDVEILKSVLFKKDVNDKIFLFEVINLAINSGLKINPKEIKCEIKEF